jgi:hypothetical protein
MRSNSVSQFLFKTTALHVNPLRPANPTKRNCLRVPSPEFWPAVAWTRHIMFLDWHKQAGDQEQWSERGYRGKQRIYHQRSPWTHDAPPGWTSPINPRAYRSHISFDRPSSVQHRNFSHREADTSVSSNPKEAWDYRKWQGNDVEKKARGQSEPSQMTCS